MLRVHHRASEGFLPCQIDPQVRSDVDFDELTEPHPPSMREPLDQFLFALARQIHDSPPVKGSLVVAINRVLNVKERLCVASSKHVPLMIDECCCSNESGTLPRGVEEDLLQDQPAL